MLVGHISRTHQMLLRTTTTQNLLGVTLPLAISCIHLLTYGYIDISTRIYIANPLKHHLPTTLVLPECQQRETTWGALHVLLNSVLWVYPLGLDPPPWGPLHLGPSRVRILQVLGWRGCLVSNRQVQSTVGSGLGPALVLLTTACSLLHQHRFISMLDL